MKKLKYPYRTVCDFIKMKEEYKSLDKKSKKNYIIRKILKIVLFLLFIGLEVILFLSLRIIENDFLIGFLAVFFMLIPIGCFVLYVILSQYFVVDIKVLQKDLLYKINAPLYKYYNISDDKVITKCYDCSNNKYINQDVILFIYNDKLRIINNIYWNRYDFGCYEFSKEEVMYSYDKFGRLISCRLNCGKESFVLGIRALPYIRYWYNKKS